MRVVTDAGEAIEVGATEAGLTLGIRDFSRRVTDDFGVTTVVERGFARTMTAKVAVPFEAVDGVQRRLADLRATPARFIADDRFASLSVRGFYKDLAFDHAFPPISYCTLAVEGLVAADELADTGGDPAPLGQQSTLVLLQPAMVTPAALAASNVPETDAAEWSRAATYPAGARVIRTTTHRVYESLVDANTGNDPPADPAKWLDAGPTNRWAMFDQALGTSTTAFGSVMVTLDAGSVDAVALLDVVGESVRVQAAGYDRTMAAGAGAVTFLDLDGRTGQVAITILGGQVSVGTLLIGRLARLGITEASPTSAITDYSRKEVDDFGEVTVVQRAFAKRMSAKALIRTDAIDAVSNRVAAVRARPSLWIGQAGLDSLTIYGFFKDFSIEVGENVSKLSLSIEGLSKAAKPAPLKVATDWSELTDRTKAKPDDNATNSANPNSAFGPNGTVGETLATLERVDLSTAALDEAQDRLDRAVAELDRRGEVAAQALQTLGRSMLDGEAAQRQADQAAGRLGEAALQLLLAHDRTATQFRDAGFVVDPVNGVVSFWAVDELGRRQNRVEQTLDAQRALIVTKASSSEVDEKILRAVLRPEQVAQLEPLLARLGAVETVQDALRAEISNKAELIELTRAVERITTAEQRISAAEGLVKTSVQQAIFDKAMARVGVAEQLLQSYGDVSRYDVRLRQAELERDRAGEALLAGVLAADAGEQRRVTAEVGLRQEMVAQIDRRSGAVEARVTTRLEAATARQAAATLAEQRARVDGQEALAEDISGLRAAGADQEAAIATLRRASVTQAGGLAGIETVIRQQGRGADQAAEALLAGIIAADDARERVNDSLVEITQQFTTTMLAGFSASAAARQTLRARIDAADARFAQEVETTASRLKAVTTALTLLQADFADPDTGVAAAHAEIARLDTAMAEDGRATAERIDRLRAALDDPATGLDRTRAELSGLARVVAESDNARGLEISRLAVELHDPDTGLPATRAAVTAERSASIDRDNANARSILDVTARLGDLGSATVQQLIDAVVNRTGRIEGRYGIAIDVNGNWSGFQLIGSDAGPASFNLINTDLRMGAGRIIKNNGRFMEVEGVAFGANRDLIEWFGPTMDIEQCSKANALQYKGIDGSIYTSASLSAGTLKNAAASSGLAANEVAMVGPFGSNGRIVRYVASWSYYREFTKRYEPDADGVGQFDADRRTYQAQDEGGGSWFGTIAANHPSSTITLERSFDNKAWEQLDQRGFTSEQLTFRGTAPQPADTAPGIATISQSIGGGFTVNDKQQAAVNRWLRLSLARGLTYPLDGTIQRLTIVAVEE